MRADERKGCRTEWEFPAMNEKQDKKAGTEAALVP